MQTNWNQGMPEHYYKDIWWPFIEGLTKEERIAYLEKWRIPEDLAWQQWPDRVFRIAYVPREDQHDASS
jgi:hypothetical protein